MIIGIALCIISMIILSVRNYKKPTNFLQYFLTFSKSFYMIGLLSSSFIEEEHHYWYYFTSTLFFLAFFYELQNGSVDFKILLILVTNRIMKSWNQSGIKYKNDTSISDYIETIPHLSLILATISIIILTVYCITQSKSFIQSILIFMNSILLIFFKFSLINFFAQILYYQIFSTLAYSLLYIKFHKNLFQHSIYILLLLIHKNNQSLLILLLIFQSKISKDYQKNFTFHYYLFQTSFYYFGRSISITSIDFSGAFTGLNEYNLVLVSILLILIIYSGPIIYLIENSNFIKEKFHFKMIEMTIIGILLYFMREHLFIWSVFSPKFLFEIFHIIFIIFAGLFSLIINYY